MSNLLRTVVPGAYAALMNVVGDPITYRRGTVDRSANIVFLRTAESEPNAFGNVLQGFISLAELGGLEPAVGDEILFQAKTYRVNQVQANDYEGYLLTLRAL